jgi:DNA-binding LacI/PurR family transcriptional regulator
MKKISQKDIAESLHISRVTVTKALQEHPDIARETIRKVKDKALELGYIPDFIGRSLSSRRTMNIGVVIPKIAHSFFSYSIERMYETARKNGYNIIPMVSFEDQDNEIENIRTLLSMRVDGIILDVAQNSVNSKSCDLARQAGCKLVFFDRHPLGCKQDSIVTDDRDASYKLTKHLIEKGYKKIHFFSGPPNLNISQERKRGHEDAMHESRRLVRILNVELQRESGYRAMMRMNEDGDSADAIFAVNDSVAIGIYEAAGKLGLKIPDDVAVAGFGDVETSSLLKPPMTSVKPPLDEMAAASVEMIIDMIENNVEGLEQQIFPSQLIQRQST